MKKLIVAACLTGACVAFADESAKDCETCTKECAAACAEAGAAEKPAAAAVQIDRKQMDEVRRAKMREMREKVMKERKEREEAFRNKSVEIVKKYGLDDAKATALVGELEALVKESQNARRTMRKMKGGAEKKAE